MGKIIDLTGQKFGRLTAVEFLGIQNKKTLWRCLCECGNEKTSSSTLLRTGDTKSCGCLKTETTIERNTTHGLAKTSPIYTVWKCMRGRCNNENEKDFKHYGGRGIKVCERWNSFMSFHEDMFPTFRPGLTLDRIDVNGNYEPSNCRWVTQAFQKSNTRKNHYIMCDGEKMTIREASRRYGIEHSKLSYRILHGWSVEDAINPRDGRVNNGKRKSVQGSC